MKLAYSRAIGRRALLGAGGVALTLPFLEALAPKRLQAAAPAVPVRLVYWSIPNGVVYERWTPTSVGPLDPTNLPACLRPLADASLIGDVSIVSGLDNFSAVPIFGGDHACGTCGLLTSTSAKKAADLSDVELAASVDQMAAKALGAQTPRPSLELGMQPGGGTGECDTGYACAYAQSISWSDATTPRGKRTDPHDAWLYLLGTDESALSPAERERLRQGDKSVLDFVIQQSSDLNRQIGASDRVKLDQYLSERAHARTAADSGHSARAVSDTTRSRHEWRLRDAPWAADADVMEFALKCDLTRVVSFMMTNAFGPGPMPWVNIAEDFHGLTHAMDQPGVKDKLETCITWEVKQAAAFAQRLKAIPEGDKTLLYNTAFMVSSDVADGFIHSHHEMPVLLGWQRRRRIESRATYTVYPRGSVGSNHHRAEPRRADQGARHSQY